jgi:CHASE2 domain-containing sensor protein
VFEIDDLEVGQLIEYRYELIQKLGDGGFAVVWEVKDTQANSDRKAIKFLKRQDALDIELFRNEFWTLDGLSCDRIVKVQPDSLYPEQEPDEDDDTLHFFVMEKVEGQTLEKLIEDSVIKPDNQKLSFAKSIWQFLFCRYPPLRSRLSYLQIANLIEQLAEVVHHFQTQSGKIIHRDIKPANIIITSDEDIKLIDFGAATFAMTEDHEYKCDTESGTRIYTPTYAAPEQKNGQARLPSDFYTFGYTILFALTGQEPSKLPSNWRSQFPSKLTTFLDKATNEEPAKRHANAKNLLDEAKDLAESLRRKYSRWNMLGQVVKVLGIAAIATVAIVGIRSTGKLQDIELKAYDLMIQMGPDLGADPRLLIVDMTSDFKDISDQDLVEILPRLTRYQPRAIGITLQRDEISTFTDESRAALQQIYQQNNNIFGSCVHADSDLKKAGFTFIPSPSTSLGFRNSPLDEDKFFRRHLLIYRNPPKDECKATASFSLLIAHHYLKSNYKYNENISTYNLEKAQFQSLELGQGAYRNPKMEEFKNLFQIMIDYRSRNISQIVPVKQILTEDFSSVRDRIVLIGRASSRDSLLPLTPYGSLVEISGVEIIGQLISQLIDAAEGKRPILKPATFALDLIWIVCASCLGGFIGWRVGSPIGQVIVLLTLPTTLIGVCFLFFVTQGLWLGAVPIIIVAIVANFSVFLYNRYNRLFSTNLWGLYEHFKYRD